MDRKLSAEEIRKYKKGQLTLSRIIPIIIEVVIIYFLSSSVFSSFANFDKSLLNVLKVGLYIVVILLTLLMLLGSFSKIHEGLRLQRNLGLIYGVVKDMNIIDRGKNFKMYRMVITPKEAYRYDDRFGDFNKMDLNSGNTQDQYINVTKDQYSQFDKGDKVECILGMMSKTIYDIKKV